ncbi:hypothetical protein ACUL41_06770 [Virgibacillus natechei]|uniref:hypothetical protein n=1 Tax=Virgibacillus sp. CBA3643 TaxID=2942278 RepID=UPI0035A3AD75
MDFLYFPDDKTEYIPSVIILVIFVALAFGAMYLVYKKSKKEERKFNEKYGINTSDKNDESDPTD